MLIAIYQNLGAALLYLILLSVVFLYIKEHGIIDTAQNVLDSLKDKHYRCKLYLCFWIIVILLQTLLSREIWVYPLSNVIGVWGLFDEQGNYYTENIENFALFLPYTITLLMNLKQERFNLFQILKKTFLASLGLSFVIEICQLCFRVGTFQLSDIFFNTLGGTSGGLIYWIGHKVKHRKD